MYDKIKFWFNTGLWTEDMVRSAVSKEVITKEQFVEITGKDY